MEGHSLGHQDVVQRACGRKNILHQRACIKRSNELRQPPQSSNNVADGVSVLDASELPPEQDDAPPGDARGHTGLACRGCGGQGSAEVQLLDTTLRRGPLVRDIHEPESSVSGGKAGVDDSVQDQAQVHQEVLLPAVANANLRRGAFWRPASELHRGGGHRSR